MRTNNGSYRKAALFKSGRRVRLLHSEHGAATDVNDYGRVVGWGGTPGLGKDRAFMWTKRMRNRPYKVIRRNDDCYRRENCYDEAYGINNQEWVVGRMEPYPGVPFLARRAEPLIRLGVLPGRSSGKALAINDRGEVVGSCWNESENEYEYAFRTEVAAFRWQRGELRDLNKLIPQASGWVLQEARDINNRGQIVGYGRHNGLRRAFLLNPR